MQHFYVVDTASSFDAKTLIVSIVLRFCFSISLPSASPPAIEGWPQGSLMCILGGSPRESRREKKEKNKNKKSKKNGSGLCSKVCCNNLLTVFVPC